MKKITVIYDFDGTLADTAHDYSCISAEVFINKAKMADRGSFDKDKLIQFLDRPDITGLGTLDKLRAVKIAFDIDLTDMARGISAALKPLKKALYESGETTLCPNVLDTVTKLSKAKYKQGVASTNKQDILDEAINRFKLRPIFNEAVFSTLDTEMAKPAPDMLNRAALEIESENQNCVYIGDATTDMMAAKAANMIAIGYYPRGNNDIEGIEAFRNAGADYVIHDFNDLPELLKTINAGAQPQPKKGSPIRNRLLGRFLG